MSLGRWWRQRRARLWQLWAVGLVATVLVTGASAMGYLESLQARALDLLIYCRAPATVWPRHRRRRRCGLRCARPPPAAAPRLSRARAPRHHAGGRGGGLSGHLAALAERAGGRPSPGRGHCRSRRARRSPARRGRHRAALHGTSRGSCHPADRDDERPMCPWMTVPSSDEPRFEWGACRPFRRTQWRPSGARPARVHRNTRPHEVRRPISPPASTQLSSRVARAAAQPGFLSGNGRRGAFAGLTNLRRPSRWRSA